MSDPVAPTDGDGAAFKLPRTRPGTRSPRRAAPAAKQPREQTPAPRPRTEIGPVVDAAFDLASDLVTLSVQTASSVVKGTLGRISRG